MLKNMHEEEQNEHDGQMMNKCYFWYALALSSALWAAGGAIVWQIWKAHR